MDLALALTRNGTAVDLALGAYDLATESGLRSAVIVSLYSDRRAQADDVPPDGTDDRRGFWSEPELGSRLWLLGREKETDDVLTRAREYASEALAWLIEDGVARAVEVTATWAARGVLGLVVTLTIADRTLWQDTFNVYLEAA